MIDVTDVKFPVPVPVPTTTTTTTSNDVVTIKHENGSTLKKVMTNQPPPPPPNDNVNDNNTNSCCCCCWIVHTHNSIRSEIGTVKDMLLLMEQRHRPIQQWEINKLQSVLTIHFYNIQSYHYNKDEVLVPALRKRTHHTSIVPNVDPLLNTGSDQGKSSSKSRSSGTDNNNGNYEVTVQLERIVQLLTSGIRVGTILEETDLLQEWILYDEMITQQFDHDHVTLGAIIRNNNFTHKDDLSPVYCKLLANSTSTVVGSFIYSMGSNKFRTIYMKQENIPYCLWYIDFCSKYNNYVIDFINNIHALQTGIEPKPNKRKINVSKIYLK